MLSESKPDFFSTSFLKIHPLLHSVILFHFRKRWTDNCKSNKNSNTVMALAIGRNRTLFLSSFLRKNVRFGMLVIQAQSEYQVDWLLNWNIRRKKWPFSYKLFSNHFGRIPVRINLLTPFTIKKRLGSKLSFPYFISTILYCLVQDQHKVLLVSA